VRNFTQALRTATFCGLERRGKYLVFQLRQAGRAEPLTLVGHLGMTGRMYLLPAKYRLPKHAAVVLNLGRENFVFEDTRYFGRLTLDGSTLARLGPEPLGTEFTANASRRR
jgi:formamidopyrimidine-DNA glycosylase